MELLSRVGLKNRESKIYLTCLGFKDGLFIHEIAKHTRITRSTVDLTARRLAQRGFLNKVKVGRRFRFFALAPDAVLFRQKQLVEDLEQVVPILQKVSGTKKDMEIVYYEGAAGYKQIYDDALLQIKFSTGFKKDILSFSSGYEGKSLYPNIQKQFINKRIKTGAWYKAIAPQSSSLVPEWISDPKENRVVKYLPDGNYPFTIDIQIYADTTAMYSTTPPIGGVVIRNERITQSMRALFHHMWKLLPETKG